MIEEDSTASLQPMNNFVPTYKQLCNTFDLRIYPSFFITNQGRRQKKSGSIGWCAQQQEWEGGRLGPDPYRNKII